MNNVKKILIAFICLVSVLISGWGGYYLIKTNKGPITNKTKTIEPQYFETIYDYMSIKNGSNIFIGTIDNRNIVVNLNDEVIDNNESNGIINILYNDYYAITVGNTITIKKNGKLIGTKDEINPYKLLQAENSNFISVYYDFYSSYDLKNYKIAYNNKYFLYDSITGEIIYKDAFDISPIIINGIAKYIAVYNRIPETNDFKTTLINIENGTQFTLPQNISIESDTLRTMVGTPIISNSDKYLVTKDSNDVYGLINQNGTEVIPHKYQDIYFTSNSDYIIAKDNNKYGLVDTKGDIKIPFENDGILIKENFILIIKNNKLGILNSKFETLYDYLIPIVLKETFRNIDSNLLNIEIKNDKLYLRTLVNNTYNTYILDKTSLINEIKSLKTTLIYNKDYLLEDVYLISEKINDKELNLTFNNDCGQEISAFQKTFNTAINNISYNLVNQDLVKVNIYDNNGILIDGIIIKVSNGKEITSDKNNTYNGPSNLKSGYYYLKNNGNLKIYSRTDKEILNLSGTTITYINDKLYAVKSSENKWQLVKIDI